MIVPYSWALVVVMAGASPRDRNGLVLFTGLQRHVYVHVSAYPHFDVLAVESLEAHIRGMNRVGARDQIGGGVRSGGIRGDVRGITRGPRRSP